MLILSRRSGEVIKIGDHISIMVVAIKGNQVRLGIDAPKSVPVNREEIHRLIKEEEQKDREKKQKNSKETQEGEEHLLLETFAE